MTFNRASTAVPRVLFPALLLASLSWLVVGCDDGHNHKDHKDNGAHDHAGHTDADGKHKDGKKPDGSGAGHKHAAPNGGTLIEIGEHYANVEVLLDNKEGHLTLFMLGAHAAKPAKLTQPSVEVTLSPEGGEPIKLSAKPLKSELTDTGSEGGASVYEVMDAKLKGLGHFDIAIASLDILDKQFTDVKGHVGEHEAHDDHENEKPKD